MARSPIWEAGSPDWPSVRELAPELLCNNPVGFQTADKLVTVGAGGFLILISSVRLDIGSQEQLFF